MGVSRCLEVPLRQGWPVSTGMSVQKSSWRHRSGIAEMSGQRGCRKFIAAAAVCLLIGLVAAQPRPPQGDGPRGPGGQHHSSLPTDIQSFKVQ